MKEFRDRKPQLGLPDRSIDDKHEPAAIEIREPRMRGQPLRQAWA
ncbi:hypothetical protein ACVWZN_001993 [Lysobacter sp. HA35]